MVTLGPLHPPDEPECCEDQMVWDADEKKWLCVWCENYFDPWAKKHPKLGDGSL
jgi:hypothetical protein